MDIITIRRNAEGERAVVHAPHGDQKFEIPQEPKRREETYRTLFNYWVHRTGAS